MDLFSHQQSEHQPLAYRMRPRTLDEFIGQEHIIGEGRLLRRSIQADQLSSVIFYGPPGTGKTTLAQVIANTTKSHFTTMNAVLSGVKQLREQIDFAQERLSLYGKRTILFVDEVHRWNKSQQDALLPWVENGTVIMIGATTENPFFEVNRALVSRSRIFQLLPLQRSDLEKIAAMTLTDRERGYGAYQVEFEQGALDHLIDIANGDARSLLNALELAVETTGDSFPPPEGSSLYISMEAAEESIQRKVVLYDKEGDYHFDVISAFIKSIRGSDPDAALYWLARMIKAGEDPHYIFRRMLISASEDIGLAEPYALTVVESAASAFDRIGLPEGRFHLTQAAVYLATCPKSNSTLGFFDALNAVEEEHREVPVHLKDPSRDAEGFGHGEGYRYPHAYREHWVAQQYLPDGLRDRVFYRPSKQGYEKTINEDVNKRREIQLELASEHSVPETLSFSPQDSRREEWLRRLASQRSALLSSVREHVFSSLSLQRNSRVLDLSSGSGLLLWEACRLVPEGGVYTIIPDERQREIIISYAQYFSPEERPVVIEDELAEFAASRQSELAFEAVIGKNVFLRSTDRKNLFTHISSLLVEAGELSLSEILPSRGSRLSDLTEKIPKERFSSSELLIDREHLKKLLLSCEQNIYSDTSNVLTNWDTAALNDYVREAGFDVFDLKEYTHREHRTISRDDISRWADRSYLQNMPEDRSSEEMQAIRKDLLLLFSDITVPWIVTEVHVYGKKKSST